MQEEIKKIRENIPETSELAAIAGWFEKKNSLEEALEKAIQELEKEVGQQRETQ